MFIYNFIKQFKQKVNCVIDLQVVFEGVRGRSYQGDIAIDDVSMKNGDDCSGNCYLRDIDKM